MTKYILCYILGIKFVTVAYHTSVKQRGALILGCRNTSTMLRMDMYRRKAGVCENTADKFKHYISFDKLNNDPRGY